MSNAPFLPGQPSCDVCRTDYPIWITDDRLWNQVVGGDPYREAMGHLCLTCFARSAGPGVRWRLTPIAEHVPGPNIQWSSTEESK